MALSLVLLESITTPVDMQKVKNIQKVLSYPKILGGRQSKSLNIPRIERKAAEILKHSKKFAGRH